SAPPDFNDWKNEPRYITKMENGVWTKPVSSPNIGKSWYLDIIGFQAEKKHYFSHRGKINGKGMEGLNIWQVEKTVDGWAEPDFLNNPINTEKIETYPSVTVDGTLYFFSSRDDGFGGGDIYRSRSINSKHTEVENLGNVINTNYNEIDPFIAPDESFLVFCSDKPEGFGGYDLYLSFKIKDGTWTKPVNMGQGFNSSAYDDRPKITPDRRYFFFTSTKREIWMCTGWMQESLTN
ncbi:TolB family protein, partial [candidate division KSB1 bacterium]